MQRKKEREEEKEKRKSEESKDSYLTISQYEFIYNRIEQARKSLKA